MIVSLKNIKSFYLHVHLTSVKNPGPLKQRLKAECVILLYCFQRRDFHVMIIIPAAYQIQKPLPTLSWFFLLNESGSNQVSQYARAWLSQIDRIDSALRKLRTAARPWHSPIPSFEAKALQCFHRPESDSRTTPGWRIHPKVIKKSRESGHEGTYVRTLIHVYAHANTQHVDRPSSINHQ